MVEHVSQNFLLSLWCVLIMLGGVGFIAWFFFDIIWNAFQIKATQPDIVYNVSRPIIGIGFVVLSIILKNGFMARNPQIMIG